MSSSLYHGEYPCLSCGRLGFNSPVGRLEYYLLGLFDGSDDKESTCNVGDLGWEDALKEGLAAHSSILAWRIPMDRKAWQATYNPWGRIESDTTEAT